MEVKQPVKEAERSEPLGATLRDNYIYFNRGGIASFTFKLTPNESDGHSISNGQKFSGVESGVDKNGTPYILVKASRHKTGKVAEWFRQKARKGATLGNSSKPYPEELNFAIHGDLEIKMVDGNTILCHDLVIGQGSAGSSNNWWISGIHMETGARFSKFGITASAIAQICGYPAKPGGALVAFVSANNVNNFTMIIQEIDLSEV